MKQNETIRPASTDLDHALVVACGLTQILEEGSGCRCGAVCIPDHDSWWVKPQVSHVCRSERESVISDCLVISDDRSEIRIRQEVEDSHRHSEVAD